MRMPISIAQHVFNAALDAVLPPAMVRSCLTRKGDILHVGEKSYKLSQNVHIVGFGKAVSGMCRASQEILNDHIVKGVLSIPTGTTATLAKANKRFLLPEDDGKIVVCEGAENNLPDENSYLATIKAFNMVRNLTKNDILLTLISGGGSALLCFPTPPLTVKDKLDVTILLAKHGASIQELNTIRKGLSKVKGGGLAKAAFPAKVVSLILSDIIGDPMDLIASGPTVCNTSKPEECIAILKKFKAYGEVPKSVQEILKTASEGSSDCQDFSHVQNVLVGTNSIAVNAAVQEAQKLGYTTFVLSNKLDGEARDVGAFFIDLAKLLAEGMKGKTEYSIKEETRQLLKGVFYSNFHWKEDVSQMMQKFCDTPRDKCKLCIIGAGETVVKVRGNGKGGRNQEMVLAALIHYFDHMEGFPEGLKLTFLSAGTDGQDGPTDACGAVFNNGGRMPINSWKDLKEAKDCLANNDSYNFFNRRKDNILKIGLTGTNVMDLHILQLQT